MARPHQPGSLITFPEKPIKVGTKVVQSAKYVRFQMAEVAVPRELFAAILAKGRLLLRRLTRKRLSRHSDTEKWSGFSAEKEEPLTKSRSLFGVG